MLCYKNDERKKYNDFILIILPIFTSFPFIGQANTHIDSYWVPFSNTCKTVELRPHEFVKF